MMEREKELGFVKIYVAVYRNSHCPMIAINVAIYRATF